MLFWSGRSLVGWLLTIAGILFILVGVIANMHIHFRPHEPLQYVGDAHLVCGRAGIDDARASAISWAPRRVAAAALLLAAGACLTKSI
jgi:hypothetical protein